jgi:hypothetical protein
MKMLSFVRWHPKWTGLGFATFLALLYIPRWLTGLSSMGRSFAFDYFTLPRCGLAVRHGTNLFTSGQDYKFGYHSTQWVSHPLLCYVFGVPFSYLDPWLGFWTCTFLYYLLHCAILWNFANKLDLVSQQSISSHLIFAALGLFFPWYLNYHLGQYHLIFVGALAFVLSGNTVLGFSVSALGKPALGPAALCLVTAKKWWSIFFIFFICILGYLPFLFTTKNSIGRMEVVIDQNFLEFFKMSRMFAHFSVRGWDQEMGWSKVFDEIFSEDHYSIRMFLAIVFAFGGAWISRLNYRLGIGFASLWFFFSYGRIHEYHYATFVPLLAWCASQKYFSKPLLAAVSVLMASPTVWFLLINTNAMVKGSLDFKMGRASHPLLFWSWILQKPLCVVLIAALFFSAYLKERRSILRN